MYSSLLRYGATVPLGLRSEGFFAYNGPVNRVIFLVDGFNLYHSLVQAQEDTDGPCVKWLDLHGLCSSYLHIVGRQADGRVVTEAIHYFSATPTHRTKGAQHRHALYMRCLQSSGIQVHLGRFKKKTAKCPLCHRTSIRYEEKETDVAIAAQLFEICHANAANFVVIVTGDTDLAPAVRTCQRLFRDMSICFAFPYRRHNAELKQLSPGSFNIGRGSYLRYQYPDPLRLSDGTEVAKPREWQ